MRKNQRGTNGLAEERVAFEDPTVGFAAPHVARSSGASPPCAAASPRRSGAGSRRPRPGGDASLGSLGPAGTMEHRVMGEGEGGEGRKGVSL